MAYELKLGESLGEGVRRVCCAQIKLAMRASHQSAQSDASPVHATRRHLKKARAALRLMSRHVRRRDFKRVHRRLRDVGRLISELRDAEVRLGTVRHLREQSRLQSEPALEELERLLDLELESFFEAFAGWQTGAEATLAKAYEQMRGWHLVHLDCKQIRRTVQQTYKRGRRRLSAAISAPTAEHFHEFRKEVKELSFHLQILRPLDPVTFDQATTGLKMLAAQLGQANDLAFLEDRLVALEGPNGHAEGLEKLRATIVLRRDELQDVAGKLGASFYSAKPKEFGRSLRGYFDDWQQEQRRNAGMIHLASARHGNGTIASPSRLRTM